MGNLPWIGQLFQSAGRWPPRGSKLLRPNALRKLWTQAGTPHFTLRGKKSHHAFRIAGPHFLRTRLEVELSLLREFFRRIGGRHDLDADFRGNRRRRFTENRAKTFRRDPNRIRHLDALRRDDANFVSRGAVRHQPFQPPIDPAREKTMIVLGRAHDDASTFVGFNFVRYAMEPRVRAERPPCFQNRVFCRNDHAKRGQRKSRRVKRADLKFRKPAPFAKSSKPGSREKHSREEDTRRRQAVGKNP